MQVYRLVYTVTEGGGGVQTHPPYVFIYYNEFSRCSHFVPHLSYFHNHSTNRGINSQVLLMKSKRSKLLSVWYSALRCMHTSCRHNQPWPKRSKCCCCWDMFGKTKHSISPKNSPYQMLSTMGEGDDMVSFAATRPGKLAVIETIMNSRMHFIQEYSRDICEAICLAA